MGALAGPVVAAATIFRARNDQTPMSPAYAQGYGGQGNDQIAIRDSKTLSAKQREKAAEWIKQHALAWAVGEANVEEITELNIRGASHLAMRRAVEALSPQPEMLLLDGTAAQPHPYIPAASLVRGDALSLSIAAASILAKVHRDAVMAKLEAQYPGYGFGAHKGYGSPAHLAALAGLGPCPCHRPTYAPVRALI